MKKYKKSCKNNKFKMLPLAWNERSKLHDESYSISDIKNRFEYIIKNIKQ